MSDLYTHRAIYAAADDAVPLRSWLTYLRGATAPTLTRALSADGAEPAAGFLGFGMVPNGLAAQLANPASLHAAMVKKKATLPFPGLPADTFVVPPLADVEALVGRLYVSDKEVVSEVLADLGMQLVAASGLGVQP